MKKILQILSVLLLSCLAVVLFGVANHQEAKADDCGAINKYNFINASVIKYCGGGDYYYSPALTAANSAAGSPIFVKGTFDTNTKIFTPDSSNQVLQIITNPNDAAQTLACIGVKGGAQSPCDSDNNLLGVQQAKSVVPELKDYCAVTQTGSCKDITNGQTVSNPKTPFTDKVGEIQGAQTQVGQNGACVDSALSFFLCPINDAVVSALDSTIQIIGGVLQVDAPGINSNSAVKNAEQAFVNIANSIYIVVFLLVILANFIAIPGQFFENYTIKKTLPKLIAAIILTQFMFFICIAIMDLSNIAGSTIPVAVVSAYKGSPQTLGSAINAAFNPLAQSSLSSTIASGTLAIGYFLFGQLILIVSLVVAIIGVFYIIFRQFALYVLIIISPLALAAWVLPGTSKYTKQWFELFIKLCLMYLIVMLIIAFTAIGVDIFKNIAAPDSNGLIIGLSPASDPAKIFALIAALIVPLIGLILISRAFKWSSKAVTEVGKLASESRAGKLAANQTKSAVKKSAQEGKLAEVKGGAMEKFGKSIGGERGLKLEAKGRNIKNAPGKRLQENLESLGLDRVLTERNTKGDLGDAARRIITAKRRDLANTRNLDAGQMYEAMRVMNPNRHPDDIRNQMTQQYGITFDSDGKVITDTNDPGYSAANAATYSNPYYQGGGQTGPQPGTGTNTPTPAGAAPGGGGGGRPAPAAAPGGTGTSGTATPGTGAGPGQARSSAAQFNRGARAGRAATGSSAAPLSNPNATPPPNPAGGPPGGGGTPPAPPAGPPPGFPGP